MLRVVLKYMLRMYHVGQSGQASSSIGISKFSFHHVFPGIFVSLFSFLVGTCSVERRSSLPAWGCSDHGGSHG